MLVVGSSGSGPASTARMAAASATVRVMGPTWSIDAEFSNTPWRDTRPQVGLSPARLLAAAGNRIDPPVSVPRAPKHSPAAGATPGPLEDAPGQYFALHGFSGGVMSGRCCANA